MTQKWDPSRPTLSYHHQPDWPTHFFVYLFSGPGNESTIELSSVQVVLAPPLQVSTTGWEIVAGHLRKAEPSVLIQSGPRSSNVNGMEREHTRIDSASHVLIQPSSFINYI